MREQTVSDAERFDLARSSIALVRCARDDDEEGFAALAMSADPYLLLGMVCRLTAQLVDASSPDPARTLSMLAEFAIEQAPSPG